MVGAAGDASARRRLSFWRKRLFLFFFFNSPSRKSNERTGRDQNLSQRRNLPSFFLPKLASQAATLPTGYRFDSLFIVWHSCSVVIASCYGNFYFTVSTLWNPNRLWTCLIDYRWSHCRWLSSSMVVKTTTLWPPSYGTVLSLSQ